MKTKEAGADAEAPLGVSGFVTEQTARLCEFGVKFFQILAIS